MNAAVERYKVFDTALPQMWVNEMRRRWGIDVRGRFVWTYDDARTFGAPGPINAEGDALMELIKDGTMTFEVTAEDISKGVAAMRARNDSAAAVCPITQAVRRITGADEDVFCWTGLEGMGWGEVQGQMDVIATSLVRTVDAYITSGLRYPEPATIHIHNLKRYD
jgi:hypothetical protein